MYLYTCRRLSYLFHLSIKYKKAIKINPPYTSYLLRFRDHIHTLDEEEEVGNFSTLLILQVL